MPSFRTVLTATVVALGSISTVVADIQLAGCYDTYGTTYNGGLNPYQTQGSCHDQCLGAEKAVFAVTKGSTCFCGDTVPSTGKVPDTECNVQCNGYNQTCGGETTWQFGYTGVLPPSVPKPSSSSSTSTKSSAPAQQTTVIVQGPATVTAAPEGNSSSPAKPSGGNKAGVAAGIVVGVVVIIAIGIGIFLFVRRNRRIQAEEEYQAAVAAKEFTASIRKPQADSRLDPVMLQHRLSDGSIADNQDFSRRILKVTNPDGN